MRDIYMVLVGPTGSVFVKTLDYFKEQGGFREAWGLYWVPIIANGVENAREIGCELPGARPYERQAK